MEEGFVRFMRKWYYFVGVIIALVAMMFAVFYPALAVVIVIGVLVLAGFFLFYYYKYELLKKEKNPFKNAPPPTMRVEEVTAETSNMPDLEMMALKAAAGGPKVKAHVIEGSGMEMVERYFPLGEMMFPITFIAKREERDYQEGSFEVGEPLCLWHTTPVWISRSSMSDDRAEYLIHCNKCPHGGKHHDKSLDDTKQAVEVISVAMLREGKMQMNDETLFEAVKRGRGELPG
jgi:hypothetical protein